MNLLVLKNALIFLQLLPPLPKKRNEEKKPFDIRGESPALEVHERGDGRGRLDIWLT